MQSHTTFQDAYSQTDAIDVTALLAEKGIAAPQEIISIIVEVLKTKPDLASAAIVRLANQLSITMFGKEITDIVSTTAGRKIYNLHPYRKAGSGAVCLAAFQDPQQEFQVLLGRKKPRPNQKDQLILLGGYFQPYPLDGHMPDTEKLTAEEKDQIEEEALIRGAEKAYLDFKIVTSVAARKKYITYDTNITACAQRELKEETSLSGIEPQFLLEQSTYPDTNPDLHSINLSYLFDCGSREQAPPVAAGSDIQTLQWIKLSAIERKTDDNGIHYFTGEQVIRRDHGPVLERGARVLYGNQIRLASGGLLTLETLERYIAHAASQAHQKSNLLGVTPASFLGETAKTYCGNLEIVAREFWRCAQGNIVFDFTKIAECLKPKTSLLTSLSVFATPQPATPATRLEAVLPRHASH
jgi:8-oxo-dGTP pyrophosphatase MutT (NUDIX family)